jgi:3-oxoacyl-[acyl-carrier protein] reductase
MSGFKDSIILITGAASGLGRSLAESIASRGAVVLANYHNQEQEANELLLMLRRWNSRSQIYKADVSNCQEVSSMFSKITDSYGQLDGLVNCAGTVDFQKLESSDISSIDRQIKVNLMGTIYTVREAIPLLRRSRRGAIVNIASLAAHIGQEASAPYAASKGGVIAFSKSCAVELASANIRVNSISPGIIDTGIELNNLDPSQIKANRKRLLGRIPLKRMGKPEEVASLIEFLLSENATYITGQDIIIDGGWSIS